MTSVQQFEEWVKEYRKDLIHYAHSIIKRAPEDAEDIVQQALLTLSQAEYDPKRGYTVRTWLFQTVKQRALNYLRDSIGKRDLVNNPLPTTPQSEGAIGRWNQAPSSEEIDDGTAFHSILQYRPGDDQTDLRLDIEKAFLSLSEEERLIADLIFVQGYSIVEVALKFDIEITSFKRHKFRPMQARLRALLSEHAPYKAHLPASDSKTA